MTMNKLCLFSAWMFAFVCKIGIMGSHHLREMCVHCLLLVLFFLGKVKCQNSWLFCSFAMNFERVKTDLIKHCRRHCWFSHGVFQQFSFLPPFLCFRQTSLQDNDSKAVWTSKLTNMLSKMSLVRPWATACCKATTTCFELTTLFRLNPFIHGIAMPRLWDIFKLDRALHCDNWPG